MRIQNGITVKFPSPLGDEVLKPQYLNRARQQLYSFRPLSGMRCLNLRPYQVEAVESVFRFPSPLGDEVLKPYQLKGIHQRNERSFRPLSGMRCLNLKMSKEGKLNER